MNIPAAKIYFPEEDKDQLTKEIREILSTGMLTLGPYNKQLEEKFSEIVGTKYCIAVNSGTSALEIILRSLNIKGSSVLIPTNTFVATPAAVIHAGGRVIFTDNSNDLCINIENIKKNLQKDTKAVILVHIGGYITPEINEIKDLCEDHNLYLIEDAAHAHGSEFNGKKAGCFGIAGAFSFYPTKVITSAEGGIITTNDEEIYKRAKVFRDQGKSGFYGNIHTELGYNWRMSEIHAVIGLSQLKRLDEFIDVRRNMARIYDVGAKKIGLDIVDIPSTVKSNYYKYIAFLENGVDRESVKNKLREEYNIGLSGEVYELPCHLQPVFENLGYKKGEFPIAEDLCSRHICLPIYANMNSKEVRYVLNSLEEVLE